MANFIARVELHNARWPDDYATLHVALKSAGFERTVKTQTMDEKKELATRMLPTGTYYSVGVHTSVAGAYNAVSQAARSTGYKSEIIVCEVDNFRCSLSVKL